MGRRIHFPLLLLLSGFFALRVAAQLVQAVGEVPFLPPFEAWQGSSLPYPALLLLQVIILAVLIVVLCRVKAGTITPRPWQHRTCFVLGGLYFTVMVFRLVAGLTFLAEFEWFAKGLPAVFHIVLASLILVFGHHLLTLGNQRTNAAA